MNDWNAPVYAFFESVPTIAYIDSRRVHVFKCLAKSCRGKGRKPRLINRYLDTGDAKSTGNLRKHAKLCFGNDAIQAADATKNIGATRRILMKNLDNLKDGSLTATLERAGKKQKVTYSHTPHTKTETK
jgi:hypothetical protein